VIDQFLFAIELVDVPGFDAMLRDLAKSVVEGAGYAPSAAADLAAAFRSTVDQMKAEGVRACAVRFRSDGSRFTITVACRDGREWRITRPLPSAD
jgi:hypothetical protein